MNSNGCACTHASCINHMRRYFFVKVAKAAGRKRQKGHAKGMLQRSGKLSRVAREAHRTSLSFEEMLALRDQKSKPIMKETKAWLDNLE